MKRVRQHKEELMKDAVLYIHGKGGCAAPTHILYGSLDNLTSLETISDFAEKNSAMLTVMEGGDHWFHTEEQMCFLDEWIKRHESMSDSVF
jgi:pimeloyl-ACP methyl ester carboxylesterase